MIACHTTNNSTIIYSPGRHAFYNADGSLFEINYDRGPVHSTPCLNIRLVLGRKCNFNCSYCIQSNVRENESVQDNMSVPELCSELLRVAGKRPIGGLLFWGGEPLVYFEQMKEIHKQLKPYCAESRNGNFFIVTNGLELRNKEIVKWLIDNQINTTVSYDGPAQTLRGTDIFKQPEIIKAVELLLKHMPNRVFVLPVLGNQNKSLVEYRTHLHGIFGDNIPRLGNVDITTVVNPDMLSTVIPAHELQDFSQQLSDNLCSGIFNDWEQLHYKIDTFFSSYNQDGHAGVCAALGKDVLVTDMAGDILFCHNADKTKISDRTGEAFLLGNIRNIPDGGQFPWAGQKHHEDKKCKKCLVRKLCAGGCWYSQKEYAEYNCQAHYYFNLAFMNYIIYLITGHKLKTVERSVLF